MPTKLVNFHEKNTENIILYISLNFPGLWASHGPADEKFYNSGIRGRVDGQIIPCYDLPVDTVSCQ